MLQQAVEQAGLFFEDFKVGATFRTSTHTLTAAEIEQFARLTGDDNPLHMDAEVARSAGFPDVIAHGLFVQSLAVGLIAELGIMRSTTIALLSSEARFVAPTLAGDTIHVDLRITRKRLSRGGDRGVLWRHAEVVNQNDKVVLQARFVNLMRVRPG
jgi:acyl dehydratase